MTDAAADAAAGVSEGGSARQRSTVQEGVGRLVGFTDAVVAIAITLIVLPLVDAARSIGNRPASDFLAENGFNLLAAALSFVVIATFWKDHHRLYRRVTGSTKALINTNLLWLAGIVFLPLPTVLIVNSPGHDPVAAGLYIGTILVTEVAVRLQEVVIVRAGLAPGEALPSRTLWTDWIVVALTLVALVITLTVPATGLYPLLLALLTRPLRWLLQRTSSATADQRTGLL